MREIYFAEFLSTHNNRTSTNVKLSKSRNMNQTASIQPVAQIAGCILFDVTTKDGTPYIVDIVDQDVDFALNIYDDDLDHLHTSIHADKDSALKHLIAFKFAQ